MRNTPHSTATTKLMNTITTASLFAPAPRIATTKAERDAINAANAALRPTPTDYTTDELIAELFG